MTRWLPAILIATLTLGACAEPEETPAPLNCLLPGQCEDTGNGSDTEQEPLPDTVNEPQTDTSPSDIQAPDSLDAEEPTPDTAQEDVTNSNDSTDTAPEPDTTVLGPGECLSTQDCPGLQTCAENLCENALICVTEADCLDGNVCDRGQCTTAYSGCSTDDECDTGVCSPISHECVHKEECTVDSHCLNHWVCSQNACIECTTNATCPAETMVCFEESCQEPAVCQSEQDCLPGKLCSGNSCSLPAIPEDSMEPNNSLTQAAELETGLVSGLTLSPGEEDWFTLSVPSGRGLAVRIQSTDPAARLQAHLLNLSGQHAIDTWPVPSSYAVLSAPTFSGTRAYQLRVYGSANGVSDYEIDVWTFEKTYCEPDALDLTGTNNQPGEASPIATSPWTLAEGRVCPGETDWFELDVDDLSTIQATVTHDEELGPLTLRIFDSSISLQGESNAVGPQISSIIEELSAGTYYVQVLAESDATANTYQLDVKSFPTVSCALDELEVNDSPLSAKVMEGETLQLVLCPNDEDWFYTQVPEGMGMEATLAYSNVNTQLSVQLLGPDGVTVLGEDQGALFPKSATTQTAKLGTTEWEGIYTRIYRLEPENPSTFTPYTLDLNVVDSFCEDDSNEDNDTAEYATSALTFLGLSNTGVACEGDLDWFSFELEEAQTASIDLISTQPGPIPSLLVVGTNGISAIEGVSIETTPGIGSHASFSTDALPNFEAGTYYAMIAGGTGGTYTLTTLVQNTPLLCPTDAWEPNNTPLGATPILKETDVDASFCPNNPDYFRFDWEPNDGPVALTVDIPPSNQKVTVELYTDLTAPPQTWIIEESSTLSLPLEFAGTIYVGLYSPYTSSYVLGITEAE